FITQRVAN
ncbi:hypothetical protein D020_4564B, partial [Vibrio parahaemolyticus SBR10290]